MAKVSMA